MPYVLNSTTSYCAGPCRYSVHDLLDNLLFNYGIKLTIVIAITMSDDSSLFICVLSIVFYLFLTKVFLFKPRIMVLIMVDTTCCPLNKGGDVSLVV